MGTRVMQVNVASGNTPVALFPNGADFALTDVFLGAGFMESIQVDNNSAVAQTGLLNVYDAVVDATSRFRIGGTTGHTPADLWRCNTGQTVLKTPQLEPYTIGALGTDVTNLRKVLVDVPLALAVSTSKTFLVNHMFKGMVVTVTNGTSVFTVGVNYQPHQSGFARRRQFYKRSVQGTSSASAAGTLTDASAAWLTNQFAGWRVTSDGKFAAVVSNTATVLTIDAWAGGTPTAVRTYSIDLRGQPAMRNTPAL